MNIVNISGYKFIPLEKIATLRVDIRKRCNELGILGTILLSHEGININLAGIRQAIDGFKAFMAADPRFDDILFKESFTEKAPFSRMLIKLKKEIVTMGVSGVSSPSEPEHTIEPQELKRWLDENKDFCLLDTRNDYETQIGSFEKAIKPPIKSFREFPDYIKKLDPAKKKQPMVMFCTGGVRCEKAMPWLEKEGFTEIYQLHGGILKYFEECGGAHWDGECFVFDDRIAVDPAIKATGAKLCKNCQEPVTVAQQQQSGYSQQQLCMNCVDLG